MAIKNHRSRKRFGQHFLTDAHVLEKIVTAFAPTNDDRVLEIGPGRGALTARLLQRIDHLTAVELDRDLVAALRAKHDPNRLTVVQADVLNFDLARTAERDQLRIIGNLPYNISTPLIFHLLDQVAHIRDMVFMLQKEVALRLAAERGNKNYGRLSVMAALELDCRCLFDVPPQAFAPPPKVESTVMRLTPKKYPLKPRDRALFNAVVAAAFSGRRKTLRNALAKLARCAHFIQAEVDPTLRAENLSAAAYVALADAIAR